MILQSMAIEMPRCDSHPNRVAFRGVLTLVDVASDKPPAGARGHRVLMTRAAAEAALPSLLGMALDYAPTLDRHDARRKVGVITSADIVPGSPAWPPRRSKAEQRGGAIRGSVIQVSGYIFARDFPEIVREVRNGGRHALGMSYEIADARITDLHASIWELTQFTFTGAAVLRRDKAAYRETWIELE